MEGFVRLYIKIQNSVGRQHIGRVYTPNINLLSFLKGNENIGFQNLSVTCGSSWSWLRSFSLCGEVSQSVGNPHRVKIASNKTLNFE